MLLFIRVNVSDGSNAIYKVWKPALHFLEVKSVNFFQIQRVKTKGERMVVVTMVAIARTDPNRSRRMVIRI
ncbi:MAG: hypothetical protein ABIN80_07440 [Dyadobacter sp.]